ncbi:hypothetical protein N9D31_03120 [Oligoflexaceae bacterium]|nr:hypothetical protein [Oligoflexaceae bacterium]
MAESAVQSDKKPIAQGFGTFKGVYTPSVLTILGVIMYLRLGWVVGNVGVFGTIVIVFLASGITFLTGLSISATATNMKVGGGGAYFLISRSLGIEAGAAVGIPLFLAQSLGISFYLAGFSEAVCDMAPMLEPMHVSLVSLLVLTTLAYTSANLALKTQFIILTIIIASLVSFFAGSKPVIADPEIVPLDQDFWMVFAVFFPAVTGIEAGIAMSGDLKNPSKSLPIGTLAAVLTGLVVYTAIPIFLGMMASEAALKTNPMIMREIAHVGELVIVGIWGATLSSALGAILGAPRTLQALARDQVVPRFLGNGYGDQDTPRMATVVTFIFAMCGILLGDLNAIAPVLSMFFLTSYGVLNFSAAIEQLIGNPSWRPKFRVPWYVSMAGALGCLATMFMINAGATIIALILVFSVYYFMQRRNLKTHFGDMKRGILTYLARFSIYRLASLPHNEKSWRPNILVLSGSPTSRWYLIELAHSISQGKGFLTVSTIVPKSSKAKFRVTSMENSISEYLRKRDVSALVEVYLADNIMEGAYSLIQAYGFGPLAPNTILLGETEHEEKYFEFTELIMFTYLAKRNIVILRKGLEQVLPAQKPEIDVWWGRERQNAGLMLALAYMLQMSPDWAGTKVTLKTIVSSSEEQEIASKLLGDFVSKGRLDVGVDVIVNDTKQDVFKLIQKTSQNAKLVFLGMRPPDEDESVDDFARYYQSLIDRTNDFPQTAIVIAADNIDFSSIFN